MLAAVYFYLRKQSFCFLIVCLDWLLSLFYWILIRFKVSFVVQWFGKTEVNDLSNDFNSTTWIKASIYLKRDVSELANSKRLPLTEINIVIQFLYYNQ